MYRGKFEHQRTPGPKRRWPLVLIALVAVAAGAGALTLALGGQGSRGTQTLDSAPTTEATTATIAATAATTEATTAPTTEATTAPTEPFVVSTASLGVTGDILMHTPVLTAGRISGEYDFTDNYTYITDYYSRYDLMIANLEVTLGGPEVCEYVGYPIFNCPDTVIDAMLSAGIDMVLTANNHTYDTGYTGLIRTQEVLDEKGMDYVGTRLSEDSATFLVQDVNDIKIGMACYTYESGKTNNGRKTLNGNVLSREAGPLVCSFDYTDLDSFYAEVEQTLQAMDTAGAEISMVFLHWGDEYQLTPNDNQTAIAQALCELGVDVIVGGHPHVLQPVTTLTSSTGHETVCVYSTGNAISNQRRSKISRSPKGHTEDGMIFELEIEKWNDGSVAISAIDVLPTWVNLDTKDGKRVYSIIPIDAQVTDWTVFDVEDADYIYTSYERTMGVVGEGLNQCRAALGLEAIPVSIVPEETAQG